jgi:glycosyltransferase involved in cell wall biosynthesis
MVRWHPRVRRLVYEGSQLIRVAYIVPFDDNWIGGLNYFRNLISAVTENPRSRITPVVVTGRRVQSNHINEFPGVEFIRTALLDRGSIPWLARKVIHRMVRRDYLLERKLLGKDISLLSHSTSLGVNARVPTIGWIADFQHMHLPQFFDAAEINRRSRAYQRLCRECFRVIVSSVQAERDLLSLLPSCARKSFVLQFVAEIGPTPDASGIEKLKEKFGFAEPYFYVPNQFWAHKNHRVIIDALRILNREGVEVLVLATGKTADMRSPSYFPELMDYAVRNEVKTFRVLGMIAREEVIGLMSHALAVINPSFFEGWSTTVEEAKNLGKAVLLSDIAVHREQAPERAIFFAPSDPGALADRMRELLSRSAFDETPMDLEVLRQRNRVRRVEFASKYENLVVETVAEVNRPSR